MIKRANTDSSNRDNIRSVIISCTAATSLARPRRDPEAVAMLATRDDGFTEGGATADLVAARELLRELGQTARLRTPRRRRPCP
jgi:hypothetical protein